ncbi:high-temperature-induced dauer-formation protein-domain-containing protein [Lineolata rhizophorae]|uniref:High-temperature-induced dauer-formation protein-domain-containing protein n=1 Tax=Lineolata rhizophorae TaxID=578093 RepID=A0A6A6NUJ4_9PEZI|nr:high-temperature-induced dauer-formation protein-domain-containing protein [Lineolata rhizophorae]
MGASDSKLVFKQGIFRLSEQQQIPADDPYWTGFWELPETAEDIFSLFSPADIRRTRDNALPNLETLILAVTSRLVVLRHHPSFPDPELAPERDALNCVRVLTRVLPFVYEADHLEAWEDRFFWSARRKRSRRGQIARGEVLFDEADPAQTPTADDGGRPEFEEAKPLAEELIDTLIDLLFFSEFTLPRAEPGKNKATYGIWQTGVGCNTPLASTREFESNRTELLRLLLVLASKSMYMSANMIPAKGVKAITYIATCPDKQIVLSLLCSLLNTTLKYNPASWRVPYDHVVFKDPRQILVTYCLQFLLVLVLYPVPDSGNGSPPKNFFRHFLGRLHRPQDFQFLVDGMTRVLHQPLNASSSFLPGSQKSLTWAPEMIMLFWEALQCNRRFRSFIIDTARAQDFTVLVLYYAIENKNDPSKQGLVRMCVFVLQTMSVEPNFGKSLNRKFDGQDSLPATIRIPNFDGNYADFVIISIYKLLTASKGKLDAIYPALLAIINNVAAHVQNLNRTSSSKLIQLFASMSSPSFLLANETNHSLLQSLLEAINAIIEHQYSANPYLIYSILRSRKRFQTLRDFTLESGQEEIERQMQMRKERASGAGDTSSLRSTSRGNSLDSLRSPVSSRPPGLSDVPEETSAFAIGGDEEDSDLEGGGGEDNGAVQSTPLQPTPSQSTASASVSRTSSMASTDDAVPTQLRGMSEKARGKMPAGYPSFSRQNSTTSLSSVNTATMASNGAFAPTAEWIETWLPELPLHTILTLIAELTPQVPAATGSSNGRNSNIRAATVRGIEPSPIRVHLFEWTPLALGWYESLLWGRVFASELQASKAGASASAGVWVGTRVRLFKVQETAAATPSLLAPRGAVDAVGSNLVQRIGGLGLRGGGGGGAGGGGGGASTGGSSGGGSAGQVQQQ